MLVFFGLVVWFWLLIKVFADVFRRHDLSGWGKAGWTVLVIVAPFLGVMIYLIAHGKDMGKRDRLPYTEKFDTIVDQFNKYRGARNNLSPHLVWRLVATLAK